MFSKFPFTPVTLILDESHLHWHTLKGLAKEYHLVNVHDCSVDNVRENANVTDDPIFSIISSDL